jgi:hypothetical protein
VYRARISIIGSWSQNHLKIIHFVLVYVLISTSAVYSAAQTAPPPETQDPSQSSQPSATSPTATPELAPPPAKPSPDKPSAGQPSAGQPNQPATDQNSNQSQSDDPQAAKDAKKSTPGNAKGTGSATTPSSSNDRLFFALPNFLTVDKNGKIIPLTAGQKFKVVARGAFDPVQIPWYGILAGISQAENSEPGYGQGAEGYGKRWAAYAADGTIENFFVGAILPSIFRQDPRFFPSGQGSFVHRASYAVSRIVITRGDSGRREFNISEVLGSAMSASISTYSYHPRDDRTIGNTASVWVSQMGYDAITIMLKEFWPDIRRKIKRQPPGTVASPAGESSH